MASVSQQVSKLSCPDSNLLRSIALVPEAGVGVGLHLIYRLERKASLP